MNENINLTKILKNCPKGTEFYHAAYGRVWFICIDLNSSYPIRLSLSKEIFDDVSVTSEGFINKNHNGECLLFPSKDQRDWSKFTAPWLKKEPEHKFHEGDWVVYNNDICQIVKREEGCNKLVTVFGIEKELVNERNLSTARLWTIQDAKYGDVVQLGTVTAIFKKYIGREKCICYCSFCKDGGFEIPIENGEDNVYGCYNATPATKEQRNLLFQKIKEAGYKWNVETKTLEKLVKPKFDPKTLQPFDKVLVRDNKNCIWDIDFYSHKYKGTDMVNKAYPYKCVGNSQRYCIPYNDDTKHLVGTNEEAPEFYRYWED